MVLENSTITKSEFDPGEFTEDTKYVDASFVEVQIKVEENNDDWKHCESCIYKTKVMRNMIAHQRRHAGDYLACNE